MLFHHYRKIFYNTHGYYIFKHFFSRKELINIFSDKDHIFINHKIFHKINYEINVLENDFLNYTTDNDKKYLSATISNRGELIVHNKRIKVNDKYLSLGFAKTNTKSSLKL